MRRVKCLEYVNGWLVEHDLGPAPKMVTDDVSFDFVHEGKLYHRCYVDEEPNDAGGAFKAIGAVIIGAAVCAAAAFILFLL